MSRKLPLIGNEKGTALIVALAFIAVLMIMTSTFVMNLIHSTNFESGFEARTKSFYIAEAGLHHAIWKLDTEGGAYRGESGVLFVDGNFDIEIGTHPEDASKKVVISRARLDGYPEGRTETIVRAVLTPAESDAGGFDMTVESWTASGQRLTAERGRRWERADGLLSNGGRGMDSRAQNMK